MTTPQIKIYNSETGEEIIREMNDEELAQFEADKANALAHKKEQAAKAADKAALLERLGITPEEANLLLS